jgi:MEDS: MEthanogen/methylotroph, DcmR Sensory domain
MRQSWGEFLRGAGVCAHGVQVYSEPAELADSVAAYLASGFERDEPAVLIVTPAHLELFGERLESRGWGLRETEAAGLLHVADAEQTLGEHVDSDGALDSGFDGVIEALLDRVERNGRPPRVFGEMVDLLNRRGDLRTAVEVEQRWNALAAKRRFALLCGYQLDVFEAQSQSETLPHICRTHSHVLPARNYARFARSVDEALREVLGPNKAATVYVLVSRLAADNHVPLAQQILMWVTENLPQQSSQILAVARAHYVRPAA